MNLNYCPVPGASQPRGMRFDAENSRCIPAERMTPDESRLLRAWMCRHPQSIAAVGR